MLSNGRLILFECKPVDPRPGGYKSIAWSSGVDTNRPVEWIRDFVALPSDLFIAPHPEVFLEILSSLGCTKETRAVPDASAGDPQAAAGRLP